MASRKKFKSRRKFLVGSGAAALCPAARASAPLISVTPNFPRPKFGIGEEVSPCGDKEELHSSRAVVIGLVFNPQGTYEDGWWYFLRWVHIPESPRLLGQSDGDYWHETQIRALSR
jgi:hypothetical protein